MMKIVIAIGVTFIVCAFGNSILIKREKKAAANIILDLMDGLFECSKKAGYKSGIDYILKKNDTKYTIYLFGRIYNLLGSVSSKDEKAGRMKEAIEEFLKVAMAKDIIEYKEERSRQEKELSDLVSKE